MPRVRAIVRTARTSRKSTNACADECGFAAPAEQSLCAGADHGLVGAQEQPNNIAGHACVVLVTELWAQP